MHLLTAVQCVSALLKANCCLDPSAKVFDFAQADHLAVQATLQYVFNLSDSPIKTSIEDSQLFPQEDFISLFSSIISQLEVGDKQEEKYNLKVQSPVRRTNNIQFSYQFSEFGEPTENGQHNSDNDQDSNKNSRSSSRDFSGTNDAVYFSDESSWNNNSDRISLDIDAMKAESSDGGDDNDAESIISAVDPQKDSVYRNDKAYPPSASVLELRAAQSVLGLENYKVCKLMDSLAGKSEEGVIKLGPWLRYYLFMFLKHINDNKLSIIENNNLFHFSWLFDAMLLANVSKQDIKIASSLGTKLFEVFQRDSSDSATSTPSNTSDSSHPVAEREVLFSTFTAGLAFLCGGSPTEDKLMVAFTLVDSDSDGFITQNEFKELVTAALKTVTVCSKLVQAKVLHLSTDVRYVHSGF